MLLVCGDMITTLSVTYIAPSRMTLEALLSLLNFDHLTTVAPYLGFRSFRGSNEPDRL